MNELAQQFERYFKRKLPKRIAESLSFQANDCDQVVVTIGPSIHVFGDSELSGFICAGNFLTTLFEINRDVERLNSAKVFDRWLNHFESIAA